MQKYGYSICQASSLLTRHQVLKTPLPSMLVLQVTPESVLHLICDEIMALNTLGLRTKGPSGEDVVIGFHLLFPVCDYPGFRPLLGHYIKMMPAPFADYTSWHGGKRVPGYKTLYDVHAG